MTANFPLVSIVITTKNEQTTIENCVMSLLEQTYFNFEIIVVDAQSTDGTFETLLTLKSVSGSFKNCKRYEAVTCAAPTPARGRNIGVSLSKGEIVSFTDGDCVADKEWIFTLLGNLTGQTGIAGGPNIIQHFNKSKTLDVIDSVLGTFIGSAGSAQFANIHKVTRIYGSLPACNMALKRDLFEKMGGFVDSLKYNEDTVLCQKVRDSGHHILFVPHARVRHFIGIESLKQFINFIRKYGLERGKNIPKYPRLMSKFYALSVSSFLLLICLAFSAILFMEARLPVYLIFLLVFFFLLVNSFKVGMSKRSLFYGLMSAPILVIIYAVYNSSIIFGMIVGIVAKNRVQDK